MSQNATKRSFKLNFNWKTLNFKILNSIGDVKKFRDSIKKLELHVMFNLNLKKVSSAVKVNL